VCRPLIFPLVIWLIASVGCGGDNPTSPSGGRNQPLSLSCAEVVGGYQCQAFVTDDSGRSERDVTGLATWTTSDTSIATVNSVGFVTVSRAGEAAIRASYQGSQGFMTLTMRPGGSSVYFRALSGWAFDSRDRSRVAGVTVRIIGGPNGGRSTATGTDGSYQLYDLEPGGFTVVFSKPGFATVSYPYSLPGDRFNSLDAEMAFLGP
jgi:hypothetical protein